MTILGCGADTIWRRLLYEPQLLTSPIQYAYIYEGGSVEEMMIILCKFTTS